MCIKIITKAAIQNGTDIKNTQFQDKLVVSQPPTIGPIIGAITTPEEKIDIKATDDDDDVYSITAYWEDEDGDLVGDKEYERDDEMTIEAPEDEGEYTLFVIAVDEKGNKIIANYVVSTNELEFKIIDSKKGIIIGKQGAMLKKIGTAARRAIEELLDCKVNLELFVRLE